MFYALGFVVIHIGGFLYHCSSLFVESMASFLGQEYEESSSLHVLYAWFRSNAYSKRLVS